MNSNKECILILGGARSGKSKFAQNLAQRLGKKVLFVATGEPLDEEMQLKIEEHKRMRLKTWRTLEVCSKVGQEILKQIGEADVVILDCLTLLISNLLRDFQPKKAKFNEMEILVKIEIKELIECIDKVKANFIIVSNEVGLGLVPESKLGRIYRDLLGNANQILAQHAEEVYIMFSGIPIKVKKSNNQNKETSRKFDEFN